MAFPKIGLEAILETQDFEKGLKTYNSGIAAMQKAGEKMIDVGGKLTKSVTLPILGIGAAAVKLATDAAKLEGIRKGFELFAKSVGVDAVNALERMRVATKNLITDADLLRTANKALAGSTDNVKKAFLDNLPAIQQFALRMSQVQGIPLDITLDKFITGLKRMSPMLIDDTGLTLKLAEVTERASKMFGVAAKELSKEEQQLALLAVVADKMRPQLEALGDVQVTLAERTLLMRTKAENLKQTLGMALIPVVEELFKSFEGLLDPLTKIVSKMASVTAAFAQGNPEMVKTAILVAGVVAAVGPLLIVVGKLITVFASAASGASTVIAALGPIIAALNPVTVAILAVVAAVGLLAIAFKGDFGRIRDTVASTAGRIQGFITEILKSIQEALPRIQNELIAWGKAFVEWVTNTLPVLLADLSRMMGEVVSWIASNVPVILVALLEWATAFIQWIGPQVPVLLLELGKFLSAALVWILGTAVPAIIEKTLLLAAAFIGWIANDLIPMVGPALVAFLDALGVFITEQLIPGVMAFGMEVAQGLVDGLTAGIAAVWETILSIGPSIVEGLREGLENAWGVLQEKIDELIGRIPEGIRKFLGIGSPSKLFAEIGFDMALGLALGFREGMSEQDLSFAQTVADTVTDISNALTKAFSAFQEVGGFGGVAREAVDALISDIEFVLVQVRTRLLDLWGWAGARQDTVWGHMQFWADAVKDIVGVVGDAVAVFKEMKDFTGVMPGVIDLVVSDLQKVLSAMAVVDVGTVSASLVQWAEFAADIVSAIASVVGDLGKLAAFEGPLTVQLGAIHGLMNTLVGTVSTIGRALDGLNLEIGSLDALKAKWIEFADGLISTLAGMIDDLRTLAAFEGSLIIPLRAVENLVTALSIAVTTVLGAMGDVSSLFEEETVNAVDRFKVAWLEFSSGLVSTLAGVIEDLQKLSAFKGGISISSTGLANIVQALWDLTENIRDWLPDLADRFEGDAVNAVDRFKAAWLEFQAGLVGTLASTIEGLQALSAFEGGISISDVHLANIVQELWDLTENIRNWLLDLSDRFEGDAINASDRFRAAWLEFQAGLVSTLASVIEDLKTLAAFKGGLVISANAVTNLVIAMKDAVSAILAELGDIVLTDADRQAMEMQDTWASFAATMISTFASVVEDLKTLVAFKGDLVVNADAIKNLVLVMKDAISAILTNLGNVILTDKDREAMEMRSAWADFATAMISTFAGVVEDLKTLAAFKGGLIVNADAVKNLVLTMKDAIATILTNLGNIILTDKDREAMEMRDTWASFATAMISTFAGVVEDLKALAAFKGDLTVSASAVKNLVLVMKDAISVILTNLGDVVLTDADRKAMEMKDAWASFATAMISTFAGVVEDLKMLAAFKGTLTINADAVKNLVFAMRDAISAILTNLGNIVLTDKDREAMEMRDAWASFATAMIATFAGVVEDLKTLAAFKGDLTINAQAVQNLVFTMKESIATILTNLGNVILTDKDREAMEMRDAWASFAAAMISTFASVVEDLKTLAAFEGGLVVSAGAVMNLVDQMEAAIKVILDNMADVRDRFDKENALNRTDELKAKWADFAGGLIGAVTGTISDLTALAAFKGELVVSGDNVILLVDEMEATAATILGAMATMTSKFDEEGALNKVDEFKAKWADFAGGLISSVAGTITDLETLAAFKGRLDVQPRKVENVLDAMTTVMQAISDHMTTNAPKIQAILVVLEDWGADWIEVVGDLLDTVVEIKDDLEDIGTLETRTISVKIGAGNVMDNLTVAMQMIADGLVNLQVIMEPFDLPTLQGIADQAVTLTTTIKEAIDTFNWMLDVPLSENTGLIGSFVGAFAEALSSVGAAFSGSGGVTEGIRAAWDAMWTAVVAVTRAAVDTINAILGEIPRTITVVVDTVTGKLPSGGESISLGGESISMVTAPASAGQSISISQAFSISPTVSGNTFQVQEEGDIGQITDAIVQAVRDELGDITSRTIRIGG